MFFLPKRKFSIYLDWYFCKFIYVNQWTSPNDSLDVLIWSIITYETNRIQEELIELVLDIWVNKLKICQTRLLCIIWFISRTTFRVLLQFKLDISRFSSIYGWPSNSYKREITTYLKLDQKLLYEFCYFFLIIYRLFI